MNGIDVSAADSAAAAKRERRRKRILDNSEKRMMLIFGQAPEADSFRFSSNEPALIDREGTEGSSAFRDPAAELSSSPDIPPVKAVLSLAAELRSTTQTVPSVDKRAEPEDEQLAILKKVANLLDEQELPASAAASVNPRIGLVFVFFGCLLRVLMALQLGSIFLGNIILPFILLELSLSLTGIVDFRAKVAVSEVSRLISPLVELLTVSGVDPDVMLTFKTAIGFLGVIISDFALFLVPFCLVHFVMPAGKE